MNPKTSVRRLTIVAVATLAALSLAACSSDSKSDSSSTDSTAAADGSSSTVAGEGTPGGSVTVNSEDLASTDLALSPDVVVGEVTCFLTPDLGEDTVESEPTEEGEEANTVDVPCTSEHNTETVHLINGTDLNDCYRVLAANSDLNVILTEDDPPSLELDDPRISGNAFSGTAGEYDCTISLTENRTDPLIHR